MSRTTEIHPASLAGVLLREHDNIEQAIRYAERKSALLLSMHNAMAIDYADAANKLKQASLQTLKE